MARDKSITDYPLQTTSLLNELVLRPKTAQKPPPLPGDHMIILSPDSVRRSDTCKATGPDNIHGLVLRECPVELTDVFTNIFTISLSQAVVPTCLKATTIILVLKSSPTSHIDYRSFALLPIHMKFFKRLVKEKIRVVLRHF